MNFVTFKYRGTMYETRHVSDLVVVGFTRTAPARG